MMERPGLVLLPGWGMGPDCWGAFRAALAEHFTLIEASLPGHGGAPADPSWTLATEADRLLATAPNASWLAWSLGAQVALTAALRQPESVARLVLLGATPRFLRAPDWPHAMARDDFRSFRAQCAEDPVATLRRFHGLQVSGSDRARPTLRALQQGQLSEPETPVLLRGLDLLEATDLREQLAELSRPTLWLSGAQDAVTPCGAVLAASRMSPGGHVSCVPGAGHAPFLSHVEATLDAVLTFLSEADP